MNFNTKPIAGLFLCLSILNSCSKGDANKAPTPRISIGNVTMPEGNAGTTNFEFTATLDNASSQPITCNYSVVEGTAKAGEDFVAVTNQTLVFQPNEVEKKIVVTVIADALKEADETFTVVVNNATNANVPFSPATGNILNDDTQIIISNTGYDAPTSYTGYTLAWSDEFNAPSLNLANWSFQNGNGCPALCGWGNSELEYYTENNLTLQNGMMVIEARKENVGGNSYTSSKILSTGKKTFRFGRIDFRAKLPVGRGIWPAFWMMPESSVYGTWPKSGEIDIMEYLGHEPNKTYGTLHFGPGPGSTQLNKSHVLPTGRFSDEFHVFSLIWKQDQIQWLVDGNVIGTANKADFGTNNYPFNEQFYFIINLAVGGQWPGNPDAGTTFPQWMIVDYVRVYQ